MGYNFDLSDDNTVSITPNFIEETAPGHEGDYRLVLSLYGTATGISAEQKVAAGKAAAEVLRADLHPSLKEEVAAENAYQEGLRIRGKIEKSTALTKAIEILARNGYDCGELEEKLKEILLSL